MGSLCLWPAVRPAWAVTSLSRWRDLHFPRRTERQREMKNTNKIMKNQNPLRRWKRMVFTLKLHRFVKADSETDGVLGFLLHHDQLAW